ncbi:MAG: ester cyclase [SAR202 cluster bacterium]|nr:ester cyclase [SAR202 cluster bacterium]
MTEHNKSIARKTFDYIFNKNELGMIPDVYAEDFVGHYGGEEIKGPEGLRQFLVMYRIAFPDARITVMDQFSDTDRVATRWRLTGTQQGPLLEITPSGRIVSVDGLTLTRIERRKIAEEWTQFDSLGLMRQLGVITGAVQMRAQVRTA